MALHLHRAERTDLLADGLADLLAEPLADPFEREVVVVPAKGIERWVAQRLSHRLGTGDAGGGSGDGVCAGVRFLSPHSLVSMLLDRDRDDPWEPDQLVWPLLEAIDASLDEPWAAALAAHLGHGQTGDDAELRQNRRWSVARRVAGLFASYARQRPQLVIDWREGRDTDGAGGALAPDLCWQPELWRRLLGQVAELPPDLRHAATLTRLRDGDPTLDLPRRLSLFGHTRLPVTEVELLATLGEQLDVHLWLPQPSAALWDELRGIGGVVARDDDRSAERVHHPLLASLGRDTRELSRVLGGVGVEAPAPTVVEERATLLGWLQHDLRANRAPDDTLRASRVPAADDRSLQVHACHGASRQVDVLREVLVGLLDDDPTLEPRDILVMCPDIETYAPLIAAGFGLEGVVGEGHPAHRLRVRLADRALSSTNPLLGVAARLVELAGGRVTASEVLDLAGTDVVRRRFALDDDDLSRITDWVGAAGIRWGLDAEQRGRFDMQGFAHNTWRAGMDRLLLGAAMSGDDHRHVGRGLPVDDVGSGDLELLGRFAELVHRLDRCVTALAVAGPLDEWVGTLRAGVAGLAEADPDQPWHASQLESELARTLESASDGGEVVLRLPDVRALLQSRLGGRPTRANFRTGTLTVCTMVPMRSVPHRVVCLVGLDDGVFPRATSVDGDDALLRRPLTGERDARSEDRQLLLDAVLAATETLVVTYAGANEHTGASRPPAVPLGEILDAAARTAAAPGDVLVRHPLQPYDARNLLPGALVGDRPFSFDTAALAGASAATSVRRSPAPFLTGPLVAAAPGDVNLAELRDFLAHPVRAFLRGRLDVGSPRDADEVGDAIPVDLNALEQWDIGDRLLRDVLAGHDAVAVLTAEQLSGTLPPGGLGTGALGVVAQKAQDLYAGTAALRDGERRSLDVDVDLGDGRRLTGTVPGVFGTRLVSLGYSRLKPRQRLLAWVDLLALSAAYPDLHVTSHAVGWGRAGPQRALAGPLDHRAVEWLRSLVELRDLGMTRPLPLPVQTGCAWAEAHAKELVGAPFDPVAAANRMWETDRNSPMGIPGEDADAAHVRVYGDHAPIQRLLDDGLATYAWQVWEPLLAGAERVGAL